MSPAPGRKTDARERGNRTFFCASGAAACLCGVQPAAGEQTWCQNATTASDAAYFDGPGCPRRLLRKREPQRRACRPVARPAGTPQASGSDRAGLSLSFRTQCPRKALRPLRYAPNRHAFAHGILPQTQRRAFNGAPPPSTPGRFGVPPPSTPGRFVIPPSAVLWCCLGGRLSPL